MRAAIRRSALCVVACLLLTQCDPFMPRPNYSELITVADAKVVRDASPRELHAELVNKSEQTVRGISFYIEIFSVHGDPVCNTDTDEREPEPIFRGLWDFHAVKPGTTAAGVWALDHHPEAYATGDTGIYIVTFDDGSSWSRPIPDRYKTPCSR